LVQGWFKPLLDIVSLRGLLRMFHSETFDAEETDPCLRPDMNHEPHLRFATRETLLQRVGKRVARTMVVLSVSFLFGAACLQQRGGESSYSSTLPPPSDSGVIVKQEEPQDCETWFSIGKDCQTDEEWTCSGDDGTLGYRCCCNYGWGIQTYLTGFLALAAHPDRCLDMTNPFVGSGQAFGTSAFVVNSCWWGNPNKHWHFDPSGQGWLQWATHSKKCAHVTGNGTLVLKGCWDTDGLQRKSPYGKAMNAGDPHRVTLRSDQSKCMQVVGATEDKPPNFGSLVSMQPCHEGKASQEWFVYTFRQPKWPLVPKLFCVSLMLPTGYEKDLLKWQHSSQVGIFNCSDFAVYSNESIVIQEKTAR